MKKLLAAAALGLSLLVTGCNTGTMVEIPSGHVGKIQTKDGFQKGVRTASKFRLDACTRYCDRLVLLDVSDAQYGLSFDTFMPKDQLSMKYSVTLTLAVNPKKYEQVYTNVPFAKNGDYLGSISQGNVFNRYAKPILQSDIPGMVANFTIGEIASNRKTVNTALKSEINKALSTTPFTVSHVGLTSVEYPAIITKAKERAAERKEAEAVIVQQRELDLLQIETDLLVGEKRRELEIQKAKTKALIAENLMTDEYEILLKYEALQAIAASNNKVIVPTELLDGLAVQAEVSK